MVASSRAISSFIKLKWFFLFIQSHRFVWQLRSKPDVPWSCLVVKQVANPDRKSIYNPANKELLWIYYSEHTNSVIGFHSPKSMVVAEIALAFISG
jgi:hypothetical protein